MEITKKILEKLIFEEHMTDMDIANHFDVHCSKITGLRFKYKIKRLHKNNEWLIDQYCNQKRTIISIANEAGVNRDEVRKELRKLNIEPDYEIMRQGSIFSFLNSIYKNANIYLDRKYEMYLKTKLKIESKLIRNSKKKNKTVKSQ